MTLSTPTTKPPDTTPTTTGTTKMSAVVAMLRWLRTGSIAAVSPAMIPRAATSPMTLRFTGRVTALPPTLGLHFHHALGRAHLVSGVFAVTGPPCRNRAGGLPRPSHAALLDGRFGRSSSDELERELPKGGQPI